MKTVTAGDCSPINGDSFICGVTNVEDLILVPNTKWVIGSGFTDQVTTLNYLHLFDSEGKPALRCGRSKSPSGPTRRPIRTAPRPIGRLSNRMGWGWA